MKEKFLESFGFSANEKVFKFERELFRKSRLKKRLDGRIRKCRKCPGLNTKGATESAPGWGSLFSPVVFVGQSLCTQCMATQIPFTGRSGYFLDAALRLSGIERTQVFITNVVHCHPPNNRRSTRKETGACIEYVFQEIDIVRPKVVITLGNDAKNAFQPALGDLDRKYEIVSVVHPASYFYGGSADGLKNWICDLSLEIDNAFG